MYALLSPADWRCRRQQVGRMIAVGWITNLYLLSLLPLFLIEDYSDESRFRCQIRAAGSSRSAGLWPQVGKLFVGQLYQLETMLGL